MFEKVLFLLASFWLPLFVRKKDYNLVVLRFDSEIFMFNTKVFFKYLLENSDLNVKYIINDDNLREKLIKQYGNHFITQKTIKDIIYITKAGSWITDGGFPLKTPFGHKNRVLINLWHGMPIKYIGIKGYKGLSKIRIWLQLKMYSKHYNAFCVTSKLFSPIIKESFLIPEDKIKILGQPRNDLLFIENDKELILNSLYANLPEYKKIMLYAPTYRNSSYGNAKLEPTKFFPFDDFNLEKLEVFLEKEKFIIFIRAHHLDNIHFKETDRIRFLNSDKIIEISEILNIFDMLISDYSGMIFDYLLLDKPLLLLPYDLDIYNQEVGMYWNYNDVSPAPKIDNMMVFMNKIIKLLNDSNYFKSERQQLKNDTYTVNNETKKIFYFLKEEIKKEKEI